MKNKLIVLCSIILIITSLSWTTWVQAQSSQEWSPPQQLSTEGRKANEAYPVSDQYGNVHIFWAEITADNKGVIQYVRYNGDTWSSPLTIRGTATNVTVDSLSPFVDKDGILHLIWAEGQSGPVYYSNAPAHKATSIQSWQTPKQVNIPAKTVRLLVDSEKTLHVLYTKTTFSDLGVYYVRSENQGARWSAPKRLDPDILPNTIPAGLEVSLDDSDGLHAIWFYTLLDEVGADWVRYAHSLDEGNTWSAPLTIDKDEDETGSLANAFPILTTQGQNVHVIWAGGEQNYRFHRYSTDAGKTWSEATRIFGKLNGQAFEGLTVDGSGRVHFFGQIRYPQGIYHAVWDGSEWTTPKLIYLVSASPTDPIGDRVHAHHTHPVVQGGNQLVLTFADSPPEEDRRLFVMVHTLENIPAAQLQPTPAPTSIPTPTPQKISNSDLPVPATPSLPNSNTSTLPRPDYSSPARPLLLGSVPALLFLGTIIIVWTLKQKYQ